MLRAATQSIAFLVSLSVLALASAGGQVPGGFILGTVTDAITGQGLPGVHVVLEARVVETLPNGILRLRPVEENVPLGATFTNAAGTFAIALPVHTVPLYVMVCARAEGYLELCDSLVPLRENRISAVQLSLIRAALSQDELLLLQRKHETEKLFRLQQNKPSSTQGVEEVEPGPPKLQIGPLLGRVVEPLREASDTVTPLTDYTVPDYVYVNVSGFSGYMSFDDFIAGVVTAELGDSFPFESLKAQAVAARTYALERYLRTGIASGGTAYTSQVGVKSRTATVNTSKIVILYGGAVIRAYFSARCNADYTLNSENGLSCIPGGCANPCVVGGLGAGYLPYARSRSCNGHPKCQPWEACCNVYVEGRWQQIFGHGVGMCQRGAERWAGYLGQDWQAILNSYYTAITLANLPGLGVGSQVVTTGNLNVRNQPCGNSIIATIPAGTAGRIVSGPSRPYCGLASPYYYYTWWEVEYSDGTRGWSIEDYLRKSSCTYSINPTSATFGAGGGSGSVNVTAPSGCAWTVSNVPSWITITSGSSGSGNGTVSYTVAPNSSTSSRTATLTIAGQSFTVTQAGTSSGVPNDEPSGATVIGTLPFRTTQDTRMATTSAVDPVHSCTGMTDSNTVWFRWVATFTGRLRVDTFGSDYDTVLAAYTGFTSPGQELACNDDTGGTLQSRIEFAVTSGQSYLIQVSDWGAPGGGNLVLNVRGVVPGDFNGDGRQDLIWQNDTWRSVTVHYYQGANFVGWAWLNVSGAAGWRIVGAADFDGNGTPDLVWQNDSTRQVTVHYYAGSNLTGWSWLNASGVAGWAVAGVGDFNGDGKPDLVWQNDTTRQVTVHYYGGAFGNQFLGWAWLNAGGVPGWRSVVPR